MRGNHARRHLRLVAVGAIVAAIVAGGAWATRSDPGPKGNPGSAARQAVTRVPTVGCDVHCIDGHVGGGATVLSIPGAGDLVVDWCIMDSDHQAGALAFHNTTASAVLVVGHFGDTALHAQTVAAGASTSLGGPARSHGTDYPATDSVDIWTATGVTTVQFSALIGDTSGPSGCDFHVTALPTVEA